MFDVCFANALKIAGVLRLNLRCTGVPLVMSKQESSKRGAPAGQEMPYLFAYVVKLGTQVKKTANMTIWSGEPGVQVERRSSVSGSGMARGRQTRHASGDRRMSVGQRRALLTGDVASRMPAATVTKEAKQGLPFFYAYLAKLKHTAKSSPSGRLDTAKPGARYGIRRPIGDRRTRQRRSPAEQVADTRKNPAKWFLPRLLGRVVGKLQGMGVLGQHAALFKGTLGFWGFYFFSKLALYGMELIQFHAFVNLVFAAFILLPASSRLLHRAKRIVATVLAISLLYYDSWLPPISRLMSQASLLSDFSFAYFLELSGRFMSWPVIAALLVSAGVYYVLYRFIRVGLLVIISMLALTVIQSIPATTTTAMAKLNMDQVLHDFFATEAPRSVLFVTPQADAVPFDVIFLHVCSLSWDDVRAVGLEEHPLWKRFDILMMNFNSAASYSGPAALHLMRAKCGQPQHGEMYNPASDKCYLMSSLQRSGFEPEVVLNHDGKFDNFLGQLKTHGRLSAPPMPLDGIDIAQYAFDKSPVYDDLAVLDHWLQLRQASGNQRVALYYNTISMHDGNHFPGVSSEPNTLETYKARLQKFLDETEVFMQKLETSGRHAVVIMVPEHGAAVRGDKRQIAGLRDIPTPAITLVPVGIKVVGGTREGAELLITEQTSYLAISHIVERMLEQSPFIHFNPADYVVDLPLTPFVAQNETTTVAKSGGRYYLSRGVTKWEDYMEFNSSAEDK